MKISILLILILLVLLAKNKLGNFAAKQFNSLTKNQKILESFESLSIQDELIHFSKAQNLELVRVNRSFNFTRSSSYKLFELVTLSPSLIEISCRAEIIYYVDLKDKWEFKLEGNTLMVKAPLILFHQPNVDLKSIKYKVVKDSFFRDEQKMLKKLQNEIPNFLHDRAIEEISTIEAEAKLELEQFLRAWFTPRYEQIDEINIEFKNDSTNNSKS